ncbi:MAG: NAD(P)H-quinone oxidoreductase [Myxococcota bacterium]
MRAIVIEGVGGPEVLALRQVADPAPGPNELLVGVHASALNRADLLQCRGLYPAPPGAPKDIPGLEYAGEVLETGAAVTQWSKGDRVMGIVGGGAAAERLCVHEDEALPTPAGLTSTQAAAIPEAFMTAYDAAVLQGGLSANQWVSVNAVGSGVGTALVQIARHLGAHSVGSSRTEAKLEVARRLGLTEAVLGASPELAAATLQATEQRGAHVVVDLVGGAGLSPLVGALQRCGTLILVGLLGGLAAEIPLARVLTKRLRIQGTVLRSRSHEEKRELALSFRRELLSAFDGPSPALAPLIDRVIPWQNVATGHEALEQNATTGKIVLEHVD